MADAAPHAQAISLGDLERAADLLVGRTVLEFDGMLKYEGAAGRKALAAEKFREDRLRAAGYQVVRFVWADLNAPGAVRSKLLTAGVLAA